MNDHSYEILDLLDQYGGDTDAALAGEAGAKTPWCLYAFSPLRENLFEWVEFDKNARVLQIGADYGSYTRLLAERAAEVVVLDPRDESLEVCRRRNENCGKIRYIRGSAAGVPTDFCEYRPAANARETAEELMRRPFDCIFIVGVFEQAEKKEAAAVLEAAAGFLRDGGTLYAAAENEMGVRYLMGAEPMGTAFLESEFRGLFEGLKDRHGGTVMLYYPVPDYRYPAALYSDDYLPKAGEVTNISARYEGPGFQFGSEEEILAKACRNGQFAKMANSFLGVYRSDSGKRTERGPMCSGRA